MKALEPYGPLAGRVLIALPLLNFAMMVEWLEFKGVPILAIVMGLSIAIEFVGALMLIVGFKTKWAALALALYLVPVTVVIHDFWTLEGAARQGGIESFGKSMMIIGGLLFVFALGSGAVSFDSRLRSREA